jgi:oxygen-independent coproporphyrinogen-3 oxidase
MILSCSMIPPLVDSSSSPAGLYIHIPFCQSKCPYCSFNSYPEPDPTALADYMAALMQHVRLMAAHPWVATLHFATLYIGGGTPTIYSTEILANLIETCRATFSSSSTDFMEITVEANPNTITLEKLQTLKRVGVNRLSIGCQSFSDSLLRILGRSHSGADAEAAVSHARSAGFKNISLDLMYGLPGQTIADWRHTLDTAVGLEPDHFSIYELTVEEDTPFAGRLRAGDIVLPDEETVLQMEETGREMMNVFGYERYEISNYGRPGFQCHHNAIYWQNNTYLGLGAGAVSFFDGFRVRNVADWQRYASLVHDGKYPFRDGECLSLEASFRETIIMGLRRTGGVSCRRLEKRYGLMPAVYYGKTLQRLLQERLLEMRRDNLRLTDRGLLLANQVLADLV